MKCGLLWTNGMFKKIKNFCDVLLKENWSDDVQVLNRIDESIIQGKIYLLIHFLQISYSLCIVYVKFIKYYYLEVSSGNDKTDRCMRFLFYNKAI